MKQKLKLLQSFSRRLRLTNCIILFLAITSFAFFSGCHPGGNSGTNNTTDSTKTDTSNNKSGLTQITVPCYSIKKSDLMKFLNLVQGKLSKIVICPHFGNSDLSSLASLKIYPLEKPDNYSVTNPLSFGTVLTVGPPTDGSTTSIAASQFVISNCEVNIDILKNSLATISDNNTLIYFEPAISYEKDNLDHLNYIIGPKGADNKITGLPFTGGSGSNPSPPSPPKDYPK